MRQFFVVLAAAVLCAAPSLAVARVTTTAKVRYETQSGPSQWYDMEVNFLTGQELNTATTSFSYSVLSSYAAIFFGQGRAAMIQLSNVLYCGASFTTSCLPGFGNLRGSDQEGREWEICTQSFC